jgi:hypothetical protein
MIGNEAIARQLMSRVDPADLGLVQALATGLAEMEHAQADALRELADATGAEIDVEVPDPEDREQLLLDGIEAAADGSAIEWWLRERHGYEDAAAAAEYAEMDAAQWSDQIGRWAEFYRSKGYGSDTTDRELAGQHVRQSFGVDLDQFERDVVELDKRQVVRELLAGNLEAVEYGVREAAQQARERGDDSGC